MRVTINVTQYHIDTAKSYRKYPIDDFMECVTRCPVALAFISHFGHSDFFVGFFGVRHGDVSFCEFPYSATQRIISYTNTGVMTPFTFEITI